MNLDVSAFSHCFRVMRLAEGNLPELLSICRGNPAYYAAMHTVPTMEGLRNVLRELPPGKTLDDKYFVGFYETGRLTAVLDLIAGYPNDDTAYLGWFMMHQESQGRGVGSQIITELSFRLSAEGFTHMELGYVKGNRQAEDFWVKNGFSPTGKEVQTDTYTVVCMRRRISS